jgi:hypothetical protein
MSDQSSVMGTTITCPPLYRIMKIKQNENQVKIAQFQIQQHEHADSRNTVILRVQLPQATSVCGLQLLAYVPSATCVCGLKLLVYAVLSY